MPYGRRCAVGAVAVVDDGLPPRLPGGKRNAPLDLDDQLDDQPWALRLVWLGGREELGAGRTTKPGDQDHWR